MNPEKSSKAERGRLDWRHVPFFSICAAALIPFHVAVVRLASLAIQDDRYTSNLAIPLISLVLVFIGGKSIFAEARYALGEGFAVACVGFVFFLITFIAPGSEDVLLSLQILSLIVVWTGAFVFCYGTSAARAAVFPLALLLLIVPIPSVFLERLVVALQHGSADISYEIFQFCHVPVFREGPVQFSLPGVTIEVAEECSGIRSSLSFLISSIVAGYLLLRSPWSRAFLAAMTIPIVIFKNAVRIVGISCLGVYVDSGFLHGRLHRYSGLPFSLVALALLVPLLLVLMRIEKRQPLEPGSGEPVTAAVH